MGITRDDAHKRRATGGKKVRLNHKRKHHLGRQPSMTRIGERVVRPVRCYGGRIKQRALRLESGNFSWCGEALTRKTRVLNVGYHPSSNELVRTNTLTKHSIVQIDATPFKLWYAQHYGYNLGKKKSVGGKKKTKKPAGSGAKKAAAKKAAKPAAGKKAAAKPAAAKAPAKPAAAEAAKEAPAQAAVPVPAPEEAPAKPAAAEAKKEAAPAPAKPAADKKKAAAKSAAKPAAPGAKGAKKAAAKPAAGKKAPAKPKAGEKKKVAAKEPKAKAGEGKAEEKKEKKELTADEKKAAKKAAKQARRDRKAVQRRPKQGVPKPKLSDLFKKKVGPVKVKKTARKLQRKHNLRRVPLEENLVEQFKTGRLWAMITTRPGQLGRADGYILEGKELEFYMKKMQKKKGK